MQCPHCVDEPELPRPPWLRFLRRLLHEVARDHVFMASGSMAYFGFVAMFPMLIAAVSLVGLFADPHILDQQIGQLTSLMPPGGAELLRDQAQSIIAEHERTLGLGLAVSLLISLWAASNGAASLIGALNLVYDVEEQRSFLKVRAVALLVVLASLLTFIVTALMLVGLPYLLRWLPGAERLVPYAPWLRWGVLALVIAAFLAAVYRFAPSRPLPGWHRVTWGSVLATLLWLGASAALSWYLGHASRLQETYGALGGVMALLLWLYLSGFSVLLGAEVDSTVHWASLGYKVSERQRLPQPAPRAHGATQASQC